MMSDGAVYAVTGGMIRRLSRPRRCRSHRMKNWYRNKWIMGKRVGRLLDRVEAEFRAQESSEEKE